MNATVTFGFSHFIANADFVTLFVLALLCLMSIASWGVMVMKIIVSSRIKKRSHAHLALFKSKADTKVFIDNTASTSQSSPFSRVAACGMEVYQKHIATHRAGEEDAVKNLVTHAMRGALDDETARFENGLTALATIGSTAPFVGLFGTVWGIYSALIQIGISGAGTLDKVAAPVGEALIMTGLGLFVAIPAVVGYNAFTRFNRVWATRLDRFAFEWRDILFHPSKPQ